MKVVMEDSFDYELFEKLYDEVVQMGGDGAGVILCKDPKAMAKRFLIWCQPRHPWVLTRHIVIKDDRVYIHDWNENFIFSSEGPEGWNPEQMEIIIIAEGSVVTHKGEIIQE